MHELKLIADEAMVVGDILADEDEGPLDWQNRALCSQTDPEAFFPEKGGSTREAKKICIGCDVRGECLAYALDNDERFGIWGGLSERERRKFKKGPLFISSVRENPPAVALKSTSKPAKPPKAATGNDTTHVRVVPRRSERGVEAQNRARHLLQTLAEGDLMDADATVAAVAARLGSSTTTASNLLVRLAYEGFVEHSPGTEALRLSITDAGLESLQKAAPLLVGDPLAPSDATMRRLRLMAALMRDGDLEGPAAGVGGVARLLEVETATAGNTLATLLRHGHIDRTMVNGRATRIALTEDGYSYLSQHASLLEDELAVPA